MGFIEWCYYFFGKIIDINLLIMCMLSWKSVVYSSEKVYCVFGY